MEKEYHRWKMVQNILRHFSPNVHDAYNYTPGILEAWLIPTVSEMGIKNFDRGPETRHLKSQLERIGMEKQYDEYVETIRFMNGVFNRELDIKRPVYFEPADEFYIFKYGQYETKIDAERALIFLKLASIEEIAQMILRYAFITPRASHQWAAPPIVYENFIKYYGIEIEGFGSPLNSKMLGITGGSKKNIFCSLFPDTDAIFGSRGDFFSQNFDGKRVFINPPFLCTTIGEIQKMVEKSLRADKTGLFIVCIPEWPKEKCFTDLMKSPYLRFHYTFDKKNTGMYPAGKKSIPLLTALIFFLRLIKK
jgi:hypothetical protein